MPCHLFMIPVEGIRICDWMPRCLVQAFGESGDFTPPLLYAYQVWGLKEHLVHPDTSAPSAPTPWAVLTSQPMLMVRIIFSLESALITWLWMTPFIYPSKPMLWFSFYCLLRKKGCPAQRGRGTFTRAHYCLTFHESVYTAHVHWLFFCPSEQGLQFPYPDRELCTPDSSITTRGCSLISMCAHLPLTPSHLGSSSQNNSAKLGTRTDSLPFPQIWHWPHCSLQWLVSQVLFIFFTYPPQDVSVPVTWLTCSLFWAMWGTLKACECPLWPSHGVVSKALLPLPFYSSPHFSSYPSRKMLPSKIMIIY